MTRNVGSMDRTVRIALGALLVLIGVGGYAGVVPLAWTGIGQALTGVLAVLIGLIFLGTGLAGRCLVYAALGVSTAREAEAAEKSA